MCGNKRGNALEIGKIKRKLFCRRHSLVLSATACALHAKRAIQPTMRTVDYGNQSAAEMEFSPRSVGGPFQLSSSRRSLLTGIGGEALEVIAKS
ncbi:hypothetical protein J2Z31_001772 [Sinorhizobium kostiense]|uniref:Uncharacterized protein n=1 Tax=Sinorhizobium kostiense TaxID=76747 RepID=A0ABS4QXA6_9HYPH|nr:hypothetical protein [Sinorhizobium kostiense]